MKQNMKQYTLEVCTDSVESAICALDGGADRLELCANLIIGGTTPSPALFEKIKELRPDSRIHVLIRPRFGDFLYTDYEFDTIRREVELFGRMGADAVVVGCLKADGTLDVEKMKILREAAGETHMTLHRAFDVCRDPFGALEEVKKLGIQTILTSGQKKNCLEGRDLIQKLTEQAERKVEILAGSGVDADVIRKLLDTTDVTSFHMSGKCVLESGMTYRKEGVPMGIEGFSEFQIFRTDEAKVRAARKVLDERAK